MTEELCFGVCYIVFPYIFGCGDLVNWRWKSQTSGLGFSCWVFTVFTEVSDGYGNIVWRTLYKDRWNKSLENSNFGPIQISISIEYLGKDEAESWRIQILAQFRISIA